MYSKIILLVRFVCYKTVAIYVFFLGVKFGSKFERILDNFIWKGPGQMKVMIEEEVAEVPQRQGGLGHSKPPKFRGQSQAFARTHSKFLQFFSALDPLKINPLTTHRQEKGIYRNFADSCDQMGAWVVTGNQCLQKKRCQNMKTKNMSNMKKEKYMHCSAYELFFGS